MEELNQGKSWVEIKKCLMSQEREERKQNK